MLCHQGEKPLDAGAAERALADLQGARRRPAARLDGGRAQRAFLLHGRLPRAREGPAGARRAGHRLFARRDRPHRAPQHAQHGRHRRRLRRCSPRSRSACSCTAWCTCRCATWRPARSGSPPAISRIDPGAQRRRVRPGRVRLQRHDRRAARFAARAHRVGATGWRRRSRSAPASCAPRRPAPASARSSPRSACSRPASRTSSTTRSPASSRSRT